MKNLTFKVEASHIKRGKRGMCCSCPIVWAIKDSMDEPVFVVVGDKTVGVNNDEYLHSIESRQFVKDFDSGSEVSPIELTLMFNGV